LKPLYNKSRERDKWLCFKGRQRLDSFAHAQAPQSDLSSRLWQTLGALRQICNFGGLPWQDFLGFCVRAAIVEALLSESLINLDGPLVDNATATFVQEVPGRCRDGYEKCFCGVKAGSAHSVVLECGLRAGCDCIRVDLGRNDYVYRQWQSLVTCFVCQASALAPRSAPGDLNGMLAHQVKVSAP
jgi:hypothetical protein